MYTLGIFLSLFFISGCVKIPEDRARCMLDETPCLNEIETLALESDSFTTGAFPDECWWEMFKDEQLSTLIDCALEDNPPLQIACSRIERAEEEVTITRSRLFPSLGLNINYDRRNLSDNDFFRAFTPVIPSNINEYMIDLDLHYEFDFWGKNRNLSHSKESNVKIALAQKEAAILFITTSVAATYFKYQAQINQLKVLKQERGNLIHLLKLTDLRQKNALDSDSQKLISKEDLLALDQIIILTKLEMSLTENALKALIGVGPDDCLEIKRVATHVNFDFPLPSHLSSDLLARRPDLMSHIWKVESTAYQVGAAKADFYPRIDLYALAGLDSVFFSKLFTGGSVTSRILPALHLPIFTAGRIRANLRAKEAEFHGSVYAYNEAVLYAVKDVADHVVTLKNRHENLVKEKELLNHKIKRLELNNLRYKNAIIPLMEVLQLNNEVMNEKIQKIGLQYEKTLAAIELIRALGGGYYSCEEIFD